MKKKAQLGNLQGIIVVLVIVGILLGAGFFIFDAFEDQINNDLSTVTAENTSGTAQAAVNRTGYTINPNGTSKPCFNDFTITSIINRTNNLAIADTNYTIDSNAGTIFNTTAFEWENVTLSYTYRSGSTACGGIADTTDAMLTIPELLGLIVLIAIIGVILAVIFNVIPGAKTQGA